MAHVLRYLRKSGRNELRTASDAVQDLDLPLNGVSEEDEELISSNSLIEGASYGTPEDVDTPAPSQRFGSPSQRLGFTDRYVDWSHSQDSIFKAKVAFILYLVVAIVVYSFILEQWSIIDSVYFAVIVFTTVGYGDLSPSTDASRLFTVVFASSGIIILGVFLGIIGTRLFEIREEKASEKLKLAQQKVLEQFSSPDQSSEQFSSQNQSSELPPKRTFLDDVWAIAKIEAPIVLCLILLATPVVWLEGWDATMGFYWMFVTGTTIGFGDLSPTHTWTKVICIIYVPLAAAVFGEMLAQIAGAYIERCSDVMEDAFLARALTVGDIEKMDLEKDGRVKPYEFLTYMLVTMQKAEQEEIDEILELFRKLDKDQNGYLNQDDLLNKHNLEIGRSTASNSSYMSKWD